MQKGWIESWKTEVLDKPKAYLFEEFDDFPISKANLDFYDKYYDIVSEYCEYKK